VTCQGSTWALPGPSRLVAGLCDALYEDRVVAVRAPIGREDLAAAIELKLNDDGQVHVVSVAHQEGEPVLDAIADAGGVRRGTPAALVTAPGLASRAIIVVLPSDQAPEPSLLDFARLASRSSRLEEPLVLILGGGALPTVGGRSPLDVRGAIGPLDCAAFLASQASGLGAFEHRLMAATVMETAGWDVQILDRLASLPIASALRPDLFVDAWSDGRMIAWAGMKAEWATGSIDEWGGVPCEHPLWLAANRPDLLTKRVWRGQVAVLLPWIETRRLEIIARFVRRLRPDTLRSGPDVEALDWGPLAHQLGTEAGWFVDMMESHRRARNELAHGRPLSWTQITQCLAGARRWSAA
jgi:hypothetical protein